MDPRAELDAAIRRYLQATEGTSTHGPLREQLQGVLSEIDNAPSPGPRGPGSVPTQRPGPSFAEADNRARAILSAGRDDG